MTGDALLRAAEEEARLRYWREVRALAYDALEAPFKYEDEREHAVVLAVGRSRYSDMKSADTLRFSANRDAFWQQDHDGFETEQIVRSREDVENLLDAIAHDALLADVLDKIDEERASAERESS